MQFELNQTLMDEIIFFMEDQDGNFLLDTQEGVVLSTDDEEYVGDDDAESGGNRNGGNRYISLPEWEPSDGFRLMERFTAGLRNALVREELSAALDRGRGVFRAFKDTLTRYPEMEKLWYSFKNREMKREVIAWYNSLRESWGLELIGEEPEDTASLILEDFRFRAGTTDDRENAEKLHRACLDEYMGQRAAQKIVADIAATMGEWDFPGDICFVAETAGGEFAGYISVALSGTTLRICAVEVQAEYRGLGVGKALTARLVEQADSEKMHHIIIDIPAGTEHFSRVLLREDFNPAVQRYVRTAPR
jgi:GNAT superfamily N-acetyltransferase